MKTSNFQTGIIGWEKSQKAICSRTGKFEKNLSGVTGNYCHLNVRLLLNLSKKKQILKLEETRNIKIFFSLFYTDFSVQRWSVGRNCIPDTFVVTLLNLFLLWILYIFCEWLETKYSELLSAICLRLLGHMEEEPCWKGIHTRLKCPSGL